MKIFLDGGTGYLGAAIAARLTERGHDVLAHARSDDSAAKLAAGLTPVVGDLRDTTWLRSRLESVDGAIHAASPNDATSADFDNAVLDGVLAAFGGTGKPYVHTGGTWVHGSGTGITESSPMAAPPVVAWRPAVLDRVRAGAADGVRTSIVAPANVYGAGGGLPALLIDGPTANGALLYPGRDQHFANVHRDDIAALFVLALESAPGGSYYLGANDTSVPMNEIAAAASRLRGLAGRIEPEPPRATRNRLAMMADPLLLDARIDATHARELGWSPVGPSLLDELTTGSYTTRGR